jgi:hypothetical protein
LILAIVLQILLGPSINGAKAHQPAPEPEGVYPPPPPPANVGA